MRGPALVLVTLTALGVAPAPLPMSGEQILGRAKAVFRAHARPAYIVYVLERRDAVNGEPDLENSYTEKVWCRTADGSALARRMWKGVAYGQLEHIIVAFDGAVDPGPPTADVFTRSSSTPASKPSPEATALPTIGTVMVQADYDYRVVRAGRDGDSIDLLLDEIWLDPSTFELRRLRVRDHLFLGLTGGAIDDEFDLRFSDDAGLPLIESIRGRTPSAGFETAYRFLDVHFPETLPAWYFEPRTYGAHAADAPS